MQTTRGDLPISEIFNYAEIPS